MTYGNFPSKQIAIREAKANETPRGTPKELLEWVGDDYTRAERILTQEMESDKPRKTLVEPLRKILNDLVT